MSLVRSKIIIDDDDREKKLIEFLDKETTELWLTTVHYKL